MTRARHSPREKLKFWPKVGPGQNTKQNLTRPIYFSDIGPGHLGLRDFKTSPFSCLHIINVFFKLKLTFYLLVWKLSLYFVGPNWGAMLYTFLFFASPAWSVGKIICYLPGRIEPWARPGPVQTSSLYVCLQNFVDTVSQELMCRNWWIYIQFHLDIIWCWLDFGAYRSRSSGVVRNLWFV